MVSYGAIVDHDGPTAPERSLPNGATASVTPVAVIGMACRLPGGIDSPERLWEALLNGIDLVTDVPRERWDAEDYYDAEPGLSGRSVSKWGAFLDDVAGFDSDFFGITEAEAEALDPQHRLLLETSWEAFEHAGVPPQVVAGSQTGVFVGLTHVDYQLVAAGSPAMHGPYGFQGSGFSMASGRIAQALRVHGPAVTVDTAGSSSLLAVHMACRSLDDGESDLALAGGACVMLEPRRFAAASAQSLLSPTGRCRAFDAAADGVAFGEGAGMVLLKRLSDAVRDGDRILAVVRGTAANQDGDGAHLGTPTLQAQSRVYRRALAAAGVDPGTVGMVEAHGPGTPMGDPVEYAGLAEVYGVEVPCAVTSAKTNLGHTQSAAGVLGLIKTTLALQHGVVPHNLHFTQLPDELAAIDTKLFVPQSVSPWTTNGGRPRRAAVSAYGLSGTNVHGVLEQAPVQTVRIRPTTQEPLQPLLFPLSSTSPEALRDTARRLADWLGTRDDVDLHDLGYTLARRRAHRPVRAVVAASSRDDLLATLRNLAGGTDAHSVASGPEDRGPVWLFTGDDTPWAATGADLLGSDPVFATTVARAEPLILAESGFSVTDEIASRRSPTSLEHAHPTLFTMQVALAAALQASGVRPAAVIGHSVGETAAAVVAGALSLEDGLRVVCRRSALLAAVTDAGATASVELPAQQVLSELSLRGNDVVVAAVPSSSSTVVAGAAASVHDLVTDWAQRGVPARLVPAGVAIHSPQVDAVAKELTATLTGIHPSAPKVPYYSASSFDAREQPAFDARYWGANVRRMVRFSAAARAALEDGHRVFVELSPQPTLTGAIQQTALDLDLAGPPVTGLAIDEGSPRTVDDLTSRLHCVGAELDFSVRYPTGRLIDVPLPAWSHRQSWFRGHGRGDTPHGARTLSVHPLLGPRVRLHEETERHVWSADVGTAGDPSSAICEMALAAARELLGDDAEVRDLRFERPLLPDDDTEVGVEVSVDAPDAVSFVVANHRRGERVRYASAVLAAAQDEVDDEPPPDAAVTEVALDVVPRTERAGYGVHPALLDSCFRSVAAQAPTRIALLRVHGSARTAHRCRIRVAQIDPSAVVADFEVVDRHGGILLVARGVHFAVGAVGDVNADRVLRERLLTVEWLPRDLPALPHADPGAWLIGASGTEDGLTARLAGALKAFGAQCTTVDDVSAAALGDEWAGVVVIVGDDDDAHGRGHLKHLRHVVRDLAETSGEASRLHVVTRSAQAVFGDERPDVGQAAIRGLLKVLGNERPELRVVHIDVDRTDFTDSTAESLARQLLVGPGDAETAWRGSRWYTARLSPMVLLPEHRRTVLADPAHDGMRVRVRTPGDLDSTELVACRRIRPSAGQIEVSVRASAVNFFDVLAARCTQPGSEGHSPGVDFVGVVTAVGQGVTDLRGGDRVGGVVDGGGWAGFVTCDANLVVPLPDDLSDGDAAAVTTAYAIAYHGLHDLAHVAAGDRVLIHSATGGVGQAAIAIARAAGADVFATAGSDERREILHGMGVEYVYDSRSTEFTDLILRDTHGYGVDVVLNSLTGTGRRAGLELLAFGGRFVEIGQRDAHGDIRIGLAALRRNMAFHVADLRMLAHGHPERFRRLLHTVYRLTAEGVLPLPRRTHVAMAESGAALHVMNDAAHTGRLVLDAPSGHAVRTVESPEDAPVFRSDGAYVVTGAEEEPTLLLVGHMAAAGAGRIVLSSPTEPSWASLEEIEAIRLTGADVVVEVGSIEGATEGVAAAARATGLPLRGVLHVGGMSEGDWAATVSAAWNLHLATVNDPLDWFCCFASTAALLGSPGRAGSAAAGSWLDAFARWRRVQGLPATTIAWADWAEFAAEDGVYAFDALLRRDVGHVGYAPRAVGTDLGGSQELRAELDALPVDEWPIRLRRLISDHVSAIVRHTIDADRPLPECGIDSMGALELCARIDATTGIRVRPAELTTIRSLADLVCDGLAGAGRG